MAAAVANLEIGLGIDSRLLEFEIGHKMSAGRVYIAKCELLSLQVAERMDGRAGACNEDRVELPIDHTLDERDDSVPSISPDIHQRTQAREIVRSIRQTRNGLAVGVGSYDVHPPSHGLGEIGSQRLAFFLSQIIEDQADHDRPVGAAERYAGENTNCHQRGGPNSEWHRVSLRVRIATGAV